jgi:hypothetical protein
MPGSTYWQGKTAYLLLAEFTANTVANRKAINCREQEIFDREIGCVQAVLTVKVRVGIGRYSFLMISIEWVWNKT